MALKELVETIKDKARTLLDKKNDLEVLKTDGIEESAKQHMILPMIEALGYDVGCPREVRPEHSVSAQVFSGIVNGRVDYAFFLNGSDKANVYVEVKALNKRLDVVDKGDKLNPNATPEQQLVSYMEYAEENGDDVRRGILTNGFEWRIYILKNGKPSMYMKINLHELASSDEKVNVFIDCISKDKIFELDDTQLIEQKKQR